jgi:hypothetical protein
MGVPAPEVGYTSATTGRGDHEVYQGHVVARIKKDIPASLIYTTVICLVTTVDKPFSRVKFQLKLKFTSQVV